MKFIKSFQTAIIFTITSVLLGFGIGYWFAGTLSGALSAGLTTGILGVLEASMSLDNSIVDAGILRTMQPRWQKRYLTWGMLVSVVGMRLLFPILIVSAVAQIMPWSTLILAIQHPEQYSDILKHSHSLITAFGGAFLLLIGLDYFTDRDKQTHWIHPLEHNLQRLGTVKNVSVFITVIVLILTSELVPSNESKQFLISGALGVVAYILVKKGLGNIIHKDDSLEKDNILEKNSQLKVNQTVKNVGLMSFIYIEAIDASFSFDGVIGAFALSTNIFIIAIGLGIGAIFVRSLTMLMVEQNIIAEFEYLENGAYFAILALAISMFVQLVTPVPDVLIGCMGAIFIGAAFLASLKHNQNKKISETCKNY